MEWGGCRCKRVKEVSRVGGDLGLEGMSEGGWG
jgi:hypothetical protein